MPEPTQGDVAFACMSVLIDQLVRGGVAAACVSPGSRSTPIALALARHGSVPIHVHLDERSSAFFALGLAKATGRPVAVTCTSGTAVANMLPAVVEASMSRTPLILLTADRPPELRGTGANQTIEQVGIFGVHTRWSQDAPVPDNVPGARAYWRTLGARAVAEALGPPGGPVHLNLPFREPLMPSGSAVDLGATASAAEPPRADPEGFDPEELRGLASVVAQAERGVVLAGWLDPWTPEEDLASVEALVAATGWPLLAEPLSQLRRPTHALASGQHLLMDEQFCAQHVPDVVLQLGAAPTTRPAQGLAARAEYLVAANRSPADALGTARMTVTGDPCRLARALVDRLTERVPTRWFDAWRASDMVASHAVAAVLDALDEPFEGRLARDVASALPDGSTLAVGSSMPVRDLDAYMSPRRGVRAIGNRGASGIDGFISTVLGIAASGTPTFALAGDLSMLHDAGSLLWSARRGSDAVFVVANNGGGGIFDHLPIVAAPEYERLFVTPHGLDLGAVAAASGASYALVERPGAIESAVIRGHEAGGVWLIEVPIDRAAGMRVRADVRSAVRSALASAAVETGQA